MHHWRRHEHHLRSLAGLQVRGAPGVLPGHRDLRVLPHRRPLRRRSGRRRDALHPRRRAHYRRLRTGRWIETEDVVEKYQIVMIETISGPRSDR